MVYNKDRTNRDFVNWGSIDSKSTQTFTDIMYYGDKGFIISNIKVDNVSNNKSSSTLNWYDVFGVTVNINNIDDDKFDAFPGAT